MNQQLMTREMIEVDNSLPDGAVSAINTIWDQSAKIFAAVLDHADLLPDDGGNKTDNWGPACKILGRETSGLNNKAETQLTKRSVARLQEEHALWLK